MDHLPLPELHPGIVEQTVLVCPANKSALESMVLLPDRNVIDYGTLPPAPAHSGRHLCDRSGWDGLELLKQLPLPLLEHLQRRQTIPSQRPRLHLRPNRFLGELVQCKHAIRQLLDLSGIADSAAAINQDHEGVLDHWEQTSLLPILPQAELRRIGDLEAVQEGGYIEQPRSFGTEDVLGQKPVQV